MFILAHSLKLKLTKFVKSNKQGLEASGQISFTVKKRVISVYAHLTLSFYTVQAPCPGICATYSD